MEKELNSESTTTGPENKKSKVRCVPPLTHDMKNDTYSDKIPINVMVWKCTRCSYQIIRQVDNSGRPLFHD